MDWRSISELAFSPTDQLYSIAIIMATLPDDSITRFLQTLADCLHAGTFVRLTLTRPVKPVDGLERVFGRCVEIKGQSQLSLTFRYPTRDVTKNLPLPEVADWTRAQITGHFRGAHLSTTAGDWQLTPKRLIAHPPAATTAPPRLHDAAKPTTLNAAAHAWLHGLGVVNADGTVRPTMADKYRQIDRYLEIFTHLARDCGWSDNPSLTIADMGCGKGYLTFGVWQLFHSTARVIGIEARPELVQAGNALAQRVQATGLEFIAGTIATVELPAVDGLIALHACDTATDDAIRRGIAAGAKLILVAPCCHRQVRPQLGRPEPLAEPLRQGLLAERMAEWATDALRVLVLEWAGYRTKVIEFVASEHTPKNLMIAAIRERAPFADPAALVRIEQFKKFFGITQHALDSLLVERASRPFKGPGE